MGSMKAKIATLSMLMAVLIAVGAFLFLSGKEYVVRIPEEKLQSALEEKLPITKSYLLFFDVTLENPRVHLENGKDRVDAGLDVRVKINIYKNPKTVEGSVDISGDLRYSAETKQLFLTDPVIENLSVEGIPPKYTDKLQFALRKAVAGYFEIQPIYTLRTDDLKQNAARLALRKIAIEGGQLVVTLGL